MKQYQPFSVSPTSSLRGKEGPGSWPHPSIGHGRYDHNIAGSRQQVHHVEGELSQHQVGGDGVDLLVIVQAVVDPVRILHVLIIDLYPECHHLARGLGVDVSPVKRHILRVDIGDVGLGGREVRCWEKKEKEKRLSTHI